MNSRPLPAVLLAAALFTSFHPSCEAQAPSAESDLRGTWIVTVEGEPETRTLTVAEVAPTDGGALLSARYGITGKGQGVIEARMSRSGELRQLNFVTQAATVVVATERPDGSFAGSFTPKSGTGRSVTIARATALQAAAGPKDLRVLVPLAPDVPADCAGFHGIWSGTWARFSNGEQYLRVLEITKKEGGACSARLSFSSSKDSLAARDFVEIPPGGTLSVVCNRSAGGICVFKRVGNELWASYSNSTGDTNNAVFRPTPP